MTEYDKQELKFLAARNDLEVRLHMMREFVTSTTPEKIGKQKYENLFKISGLGLLLIMENQMMYDELLNLRKQLNREMKLNTQLLTKPDAITDAL